MTYCVYCGSLASWGNYCPSCGKPRHQPWPPVIPVMPYVYPYTWPSVKPRFIGDDLKLTH